MTIINPNSIAGITSVTAEAGVMNFYKSDGTLAGLQLNGVNFNTTSGISTFNNIYVGGTITYEDVKNVDSVGIITARDNVKLVTNNKKITFGSGSNLEIYSTGTDGVVNAASGDIKIQKGGSGLLTFKSTGSHFLADVLIADSIIHDGDTNTKIRFPTNDVISFERGGGEALRITTANALLTAGVTAEPLYPHYVTARKIQAEIKGALDVGQTRHHGSLAVNCTNSNSFIGLTRSDNTQTDGTGIGVLGWSGFDGTDFHQAAAIEVVKGAGAGNDDQPGHMIFKTNAGTTSATERLRIASDGHVAIGGYGDPASILDVRENKDGAETQIRLYNTDNGDTTTQTAAFYMSPDSRGAAYTGLRAIKENADFSTNAGRDIALSLNVTKNNSQVQALRITSDGNLRQLWSDGKFLGQYYDSTYYMGFTYGATARTLYIDNRSNDTRADIVFRTGESTAAAERLRINSTGFVGIGTNNPVRKLHVEDDNAEIALYQSRRAAGSYVNYKVGANGAELGMIGSGAQILSGGADAGDFAIRSAGDLCFSSGGHAEKFRLDSSGRVLIGTTTEGHADADDLTIAATNPGITLRAATNGAGSIFFSDATSGIAEYDCFLQFYHSTQYFRLGINNDEKLRVTSGGTLVLGDSDAASASGVLHLYQASNDPYIYIQRGSGDSATTIGGIFFKNSTNALGLISVRSSDINDGSMKFSTMNAGTLGEKLIIQPSGNLDVYANTVHLYNNTDTANTYFYAQNTGAGNAGIKMKNTNGEWTIIANDRLRFIDDDASLERLSIENDGNVKVWNGGRITILSANNNGQTSTLLKIGSQGNGSETRAIDMDGNWSTNESKSITYTHGSGASDMIAQMNVQYTNPGSRFRWGRLYHSGNSSTWTMYLKSISTGQSELGVTGRLVVNSNPSTYIPLASKATQGGTGCYVGESAAYNTAYSLLPWANGGTYITSGVYYDNSTWTHRSNDNSNCLLYFKSGGWQWYASNNGSASWNVANNASLMNSSGQWTGGTSSDRRLKDNITNMSTSDALTKVSQLQGVSYTWKDEAQKKFGIGTYPEGTHYGFIAQDVKTVWPEAHIITQSDNESDFDEDPTHDVKADVYYGEIEGVKMEKMVPLLVEAIKELKKENDALKARVTTLESS